VYTRVSGPTASRVGAGGQSQRRADVELREQGRALDPVERADHFAI
jgi:hypothetical protein